MGAGKCGSCAGKDHVLTRGDLSGFAPTDGGSAPCSNAWGDWAEVSRRHSSGFILMKRRPEAKGENFPRCSILSLGRPAHIRCDRRDGGSEILMVDLNGSPLVGLSDYGPTPLVTARCGPACRVVWEGGDRNPFLSLFGSSIFYSSNNPVCDEDSLRQRQIFRLALSSTRFHTEIGLPKTA